MVKIAVTRDDATSHRPVPFGERTRKTPAGAAPDQAAGAPLLEELLVVAGNLAPLDVLLVDLLSPALASLGLLSVLVELDDVLLFFAALLSVA